MSSYVTVAQAIQEIENWLRLATLLHEPLKEAVLAILHNDYNHNYVGLPRNPAALNAELRKEQININQLAKKGVLKKGQVDTLLPPNSNQTDSQTFDITLVIVLIINFTTLPPPKNGWNKKIAAGDFSLSAFVILARDWRNRLLHADPKSIDLNEFNLRWNEGEKIVIGLGFTTYNMNALRTRPLDVTNNLVVQSLSFFSKKILNELAKVSVDHIQITKDILAQSQVISKQDKTLSSLDTTLNNHATALSSQDAILNKHDTTLSKHDTTLSKHDTTLNKHDTTLSKHETTLSKHETTLKKHETALSSHDTTLNKHEDSLNDHSDILDDHSTVLADHNDFQQENKECILKLDQVVERLKEEHKFIKKNLPTHKEPGIYCTAEVLEIISNGIGQHKDQLITRLGLSQSGDQKLTKLLKTIEWSRLLL
ncbi:E3 ubiquitin-protein ligase DZIP3-like [Clytia hemisphaerica]|uniref:E3 ubiquitin-protein ligase DZIP3-like n=1 Tax=Clytia hemisphaerica TaxID=252671 RepID=UPI0034D4CAFF